MRIKMKKSSSEVGLSRILDGFAKELTVASDPEILAAAKDLGMDLSMKESAAFAGVTFPARPQAADFFDIDQLERLETGDAKISKDPQEE
jgi:hypothetical protein